MNVEISPDLIEHLQRKAAFQECSIADLVNEAIRITLWEDAIDLAAFEDRKDEPNISYVELLEGLLADAKQKDAAS